MSEQKPHRLDSDFRRLESENAGLRAWKAEIEDAHKATMCEVCAESDDQQHCTCVPALRHEIGVMFSVISEECEHRGGVVTGEDGEDEYDDNSCTFEKDDSYRECNYSGCPLLNQARTK